MIFHRISGGVKHRRFVSACNGSCYGSEVRGYDSNMKLILDIDKRRHKLHSDYSLSTDTTDIQISKTTSSKAYAIMF